ncbi:MAG TPA: hypothetical protein DCG12_16860 [Planctomycetaceae bacterium]|nr:hypothetical protein [Planctomycetaceae bacterium]
MDMTKTHLAVDLVHNRPMISCRFDPSGKYIFCGSEDYSVWRFDAVTKEKVAFPVEAWVRGLTFADGGKTLITAGYDGRLLWWLVESSEPKPIRSIQAHQGWARAVAVSPDGGLTASVGNDLVVRVWKTDSGEKLHEFTGHESHIYNVTFHPKEEGQLVSGDLKGNLKHWDLKSGKLKRECKAESLQKFDSGFVAHIGGFRGLEFTPDGKFLLGSGITNVTNAFAGVGNPSVVAFDWSTVKQTIEHLSKGKIRGVAWGVAAHSSGVRIAATGGSGGFLLFFKPDEKNEFHNMKLKDVGRDLDLSPDGMQLAIAHHNGHVSLLWMDEKKPG